MEPAHTKGGRHSFKLLGDPGVIRDKGRLPREEKVKQDPERIEVCRRRELLSRKLFGRHIARGPDEHPRGGQLEGLIKANIFRDPEIEELDLGVLHRARGE